jgi:hypothetical protein
MSSLLMQAAQSAAAADGLAPPSAAEQAAALQQARSSMTGGGGGGGGGGNNSNNNSNHNSDRRMPSSAPASGGGAAGAATAGAAGKKTGPPLRRGKWTQEEEAYANRLIQEFKAGLLPLTDGTTLRTFLSKLLNCDPMRISKKFVGSNCIGKQVFRRRTADLNRLTPEQIQQSRAELSEYVLSKLSFSLLVALAFWCTYFGCIRSRFSFVHHCTYFSILNYPSFFFFIYRLERRFLERVAQTNRVKSSGVAGAGPGAAASAAPPPAAVGIPMGKPKEEETGGGYDQPIPPWLQPPSGYQHGHGASFAASNQSGNSRAAAAGRALLEGLSSSSLKDALERQQAGNSNPLASHGSAGMFAMQEMQRRASQQNMFNNALQNQHGSGNSHSHSQYSNNHHNNSASNLLAAASRSGNNGGLSQSAMAQLAQNASAARMAGLSGGGGGGNNHNSSMNNLMLKTGLSREQISQLALDRGLSSGSLSNMIQRQNSFDALMSLDFQSLQSIDNLANLIQNGGTQPHVPESGMKNADFGFSQAASRHNAAAQGNSSGDLSSAARRLASASAGRMESFLRNFSSNNVRGGDNSGASSASLAAHMQSHGGGGGGNMSAASLLASGNGMSGMSAVDLANLLRQDSQTGLSALRMQDGLNQRSSSVDDFLSLVAAGDIPHQDPSLLNVPLMHQPGSQESVAKQLLAQQFLQASASGNTALANALASRSFGNMSGSGSSGGMHPSSSAAALMMAHQARQHNNNSGSKRTLNDMGNGDYEDQRGPKR